MSNIIYDIFISYRRDGGGATAGRINDMLTNDGYSVSYDVDTLREGRFDDQLLTRIEQCQDFILVVDKNCFARIIDPATDPKEDWLWQELSYALKLKKNVIPVLLAGADFPKHLPEDIDPVRYHNGPKCVHEYFDSFYEKLKGQLHAFPRLARIQPRASSDTARKLPNLKLKADLDCVFFLDGEKHSHLKAGHIQKIPLATGEYELMFVSEDNEHDYVEMEFEMLDVDKLQKVSLIAVRDSRLQKEAEERRVAEERKRREEEARAKERVFRVGGVEFKMIRVEGGTFMMGSPDSDSDAHHDEKPQHRVTLSDYYIGEIPVTQALWQAVMGGNPSCSQGVNNPVECVSWNDCQEFLKKLNQQTGMTFSLPTEVQWEYAARGGNKSKGYKYAGSNSVKDVAWYTDNSGGMTHPVKGKRANELGLYDMSGNVWEWCQDWLGSYSSTPQTNPIGPATGSYRALRGGSWNSRARVCRVAFRFFNTPDHRDRLTGFRLSLVHPKRESGTVL